MDYEEGIRLNAILRTVNKTYAEVMKMSVELDALTAKVTEIETVDDSIIALVQGLAAQIVALKEDPVALQALADSLQGEIDKVQAAVTANTPAEPPAPVI